MYACDPLPVVGKGECKCKLGDSLGFGTRDNLERLDDAADGLVLEPGVFAFGVLADDAEIDVLLTSLVAGYVLDEDDGGIDVEFLT